MLFQIFTFFRNPYERLVSAYINKALQKNGTYVKQFSNPCHWLKIQEQFSKFKLTFSQFIDCLLFNAKTDFRKHSTTSEQLDLSSRSAGIYLDHHWAPQVHLSKPCTTNYTLIGSHEHFVDDTSAIIKILNFNSTVPKANSSPRSYKKPLSYWYNQLEPAMISDLQELYRLDFQIFGYNSTPPL